MKHCISVVVPTTTTLGLSESLIIIYKSKCVTLAHESSDTQAPFVSDFPAKS